MTRPKGGKNKEWSKEQKLEIIKPIIEGKISHGERANEVGIAKGLITAWVKKYHEQGELGLVNSRKPGNPLVKYMAKKELTDIEKLEYENLKLRIENERLKKGYYLEGDGKTLALIKSSKKNLK